jgi:hypothetical protein
MKINISLSKKKPKNNRSTFLSALMKELSNHDDLINAFAEGDRDHFLQKMDAFTKALANKITN